MEMNQDKGWRKSSFSPNNGNCVEFLPLEDGDVALRNSRDPQGAQLRYTREEIAAMIRGIKAGEFDDLMK